MGYVRFFPLHKALTNLFCFSTLSIKIFFSNLNTIRYGLIKTFSFSSAWTKYLFSIKLGIRLIVIGKKPYPLFWKWNSRSLIVSCICFLFSSYLCFQWYDGWCRFPSQVKSLQVRKKTPHQHAYETLHFRGWNRKFAQTFGVHDYYSKMSCCCIFF